MNTSYWLWVGIGGSLGSVCRYAAGYFLGERWDGPFPIATFCVNMIGAFLLGVVVASDLDAAWKAGLGTGFMGGLTTYSTWMVESFKLIEEGERKTALVNLILSVVLGIILFLVGFYI